LALNPIEIPIFYLSYHLLRDLIGKLEGFLALVTSPILRNDIDRNGTLHDRVGRHHQIVPHRFVFIPLSSGYDLPYPGSPIQQNDLPASSVS
jgi:hypothetical protein